MEVSFSSPWHQLSGWMVRAYHSYDLVNVLLVWVCNCIVVLLCTLLCSLITGKHTIFGRVSSGMATVKRLGMVPTDTNDRCECCACCAVYTYCTNAVQSTVVVVVYCLCAQTNRRHSHTERIHTMTHQLVTHIGAGIYIVPTVLCKYKSKSY